MSQTVYINFCVNLIYIDVLNGDIIYDNIMLIFEHKINVNFIMM